MMEQDVNIIDLIFPVKQTNGMPISSERYAVFLFNRKYPLHFPAVSVILDC